MSLLPNQEITGRWYWRELVIFLLLLVRITSSDSYLNLG